MPRKKKTEVKETEVKPIENGEQVQESTPVIVSPLPSIITPEEVLAGKKVSQSVVDEMKDDIAVYLVAQARRELERVTLLNNALDKMQRKYEEKAIEYMTMNDDDTALEYLPTMIGMLQSCLERSYEIIKEVINNEKIMNFSIIQNNITDSEIQIGNSINTGDLADPKSRERVRRAVSEILASLPKEEEIAETEKQEGGGE